MTGDLVECRCRGRTRMKVVPLHQHKRRLRFGFDRFLAILRQWRQWTRRLRRPRASTRKLPEWTYPSTWTYTWLWASRYHRG